MEIHRMNILVLNCGSSSLKYQLINMQDESVVAKGQIERIGAKDAILKYKPTDKSKQSITQVLEIKDHNVAISLVINTLLDKQNGVIANKSEISGIGHRVVHGGEEFIESVLITSAVKDGVRHCIQFAPLHNPHNLKGIEVCEEQLPGVPQVAVFDTAFHHTLPPKAHIYAIPLEFYKNDRIRRYGFHGTSHGFVARVAADHVGRPIEELKIITCHLGNGSSITAVQGGNSIETSMGFTPLEGLVMGTRCGDIDPALVLHLAKLKNLTVEQVDSLLNKKSGMIGLTEGKSDFRDIEDEAMAGNEKYILALEIFCHRLKKYIGAYSAVMGGLDILVFTAGIGERSPYCRNIILANMEYLGISFDPAKNEKNEFEIGTGPVRVLVIPTNEELAIARDTRKILAALK